MTAQISRHSADGNLDAPTRSSGRPRGSSAIFPDPNQQVKGVRVAGRPGKKVQALGGLITDRHP